MFQSTRLLTPGPTPIPDRVRLAMAQPMMHHRKPEFKNIFAKAQAMCKDLFGTTQEVLPLTCSGTGAMTAAVHSLFAPDEKVLVVDAGKFGERWAEIAKVRGLGIIQLVLPWGKAADPNLIADQLQENPDITGVLIQISETSTGVMHPIRKIAEITRRCNVLLVADGISAVGISPVPMDAWGIDCLLTGSQKGLMLPPGLSLMAMSERAWQKVLHVPLSCFYFDLLQERANVRKNQTHFTSPVSLIVGLHEALTMLFEYGLDNIYHKQWALTQMARAGVCALGLELFAAENYAWGLTSLKMPDQIKSSQVLKLMADSFGIIAAAGQDPMKEEILRIGHMGWVDWADLAAGLYALAQAVPGTYRQSNYLELAVSAYHDALAEGLHY